MTLMSCGTSKKIVYFQNADEVSLEASRMLYDAKIMPKDLLSISVHTTDAQASAPLILLLVRELEVQVITVILLIMMVI